MVPPNEYNSFFSIIPTENSSAIQPASTDPQNPLTVITNRGAVKGDSITYIIHYGNTCFSDGPINGRLEFHFDHNRDKIKEVITDSRETFDDPNLDANLNGVLTIDYNNLIGWRNAFITLKIDPTNNGINVLTCKAINEQIDQERVCQSDTTTLSIPIRLKSHDPNEITSITGLCLPPPSKLRYTIVFQNDGKGEEDTVTVKNTIPYYFNPSTLTTIEPAGLLPNYNPEKRMYTWTMYDGYLKGQDDLKGLAQYGYGSSFSEDATKDSVVFEIEFDPEFIDKIKPCETIISNAEIFFGCQKSIVTNDFKTEFLCCHKDCKKCTEEERRLKPIQIDTLERVEAISNRELQRLMTNTFGTPPPSFLTPLLKALISTLTNQRPIV